MFVHIGRGNMSSEVLIIFHLWQVKFGSKIFLKTRPSYLFNIAGTGDKINIHADMQSFVEFRGERWVLLTWHN